MKILKTNKVSIKEVNNKVYLVDFENGKIYCEIDLNYFFNDNVDRIPHLLYNYLENRGYRLLGYYNDFLTLNVDFLKIYKKHFDL